jgi:hypothetical protein
MSEQPSQPVRPTTDPADPDFVEPSEAPGQDESGTDSAADVDEGDEQPGDEPD